MTPGTRRLITACLFALIAALPLSATTPSQQPPQWAAQAARANQEGDVLAGASAPRFNVVGHVDGAVSYSASGLPQGLSIASATGVVTGTFTPSDPNTLNGSAGEHAVTLTATTSGGSSNTQVIWRVSRFRKGDVFAGIGGGRYQVFDENGIPKYTLIAETPEESAGSGTGDGAGTTTGCGYNWVSQKMYFTSFDVDHDPHVIEINPVPAAGADPFPRNRISTFRDSGLTKGQPATGRSIDSAPESVTFDGSGNLFVGHAGGYYNADWMPSDNLERPLITFGTGDDTNVYYIDGAGNLLLSNGNPIPFAQGLASDGSGVLERWPGMAWAGNPVGLTQWGRDVWKMLYNPSTGTMTPTTTFDVLTGWQGSDWLDLSSDQRTLFYTSEWGVIYRYDVGATAPSGGRQQTPFAILDGVNGRSPILYALRLLPPGDGTGGLLVASETEILRFSGDGRLLSRYDAPGVDGWFALNISPDGQSFWSADPVTNRIYKFEIASGRHLPLGASNSLGGITTDAAPMLFDPEGNPNRYWLDGLCVMGEYTAAQEVCGNGADDDGDGLIDELCQQIEACTNASPGDDDNDGLVDANDPDCGAVNVCAASGYTDPSVAGYCARHNYEGDAVVLLPAPGPTPQSGLRETYTITGSPTLPPGITFDANAMATGTPLYTTVLNTQAEPKTKVYRITINARRERIQDGELVATYTQAFDWTIENRNRAPVAVDNSGSIRPGQTFSVNVLTNDSDADTEDVLTVTSPPASVPNGTLSWSGSTVTYTPTPGFLGTTSFNYSIADGYGGTATARVSITVANVAPVAVLDARSIRPGQSVAISVLTNDTDADGDTLTVTGNSTAANGTVSRSGNVITYTGNAGFVGTDTFTYTISDGFGGTATGTVIITSTNRPPVAVADTATAIAGYPTAAISVLANDPADPDGDTISVSAFTPATNGVVTRSGNTFVYMPTGSFVGTDTFTYTISDGFGGTSTAIVTVTVVNRPPVALDDAATARGTVPVIVPVLSNDSDPDNQTIAISGATNPSNGTIVINPNGTITYTANSGFQGTDSFFYTIRDGFGGEATARVTINVGPANRFDSCVCATARASLGEIWPPNHKKTEVITITNAVDPSNGAPLAIKILGIYQDEPTDYLGDGDTEIDAGGVGTSQAWVRAERTGNPNAADNGRVYEIVFEATAADGANCQGKVFTGVPHDQGQGNYIWDDGIRYDSTVAGGPIVRDALQTERNLTDADLAARGFVQKFAAQARIGGGSLTEIQIGPTIAAPVASDHFNWTSGQPVSFMLWRMGAITYFVLINNTQFEYVAYNVNCDNGECNDLFLRVQASATGTVTLSSLAINGKPLPDTVVIPAGGQAKSLRLTGLEMDAGVVLTGLAKLEWTAPAPTGSALNFQVLVGKACPPQGSTGGGGGSGTPPFGRDDAYTTNEDTPLTVSAPAILANDLTFGSALSATLVQAPTHGTLALNANGSFTYTPEPNYSGPDSFKYTAGDGALTSEVTTVGITVMPVSDLPVAVNDAATTNENTPVTIAVLNNDSDPIGGALTIESITQPANGTAVISGTQVLFTPANKFVGVTTFTYTVRGSEGQATATVTVTVLNVNDPPVAVNDAYTTAEDTALTIAAPGVKSNDTDPDAGDTSMASIVAQPAHGTVTLNAAGSFVYTPALNYNGTDSFTYSVRDAGGLDSNVATVTITITPVNDAPVAVNDSWAVVEDGVLQISAPGVKANDTDVDNTVASLTVTIVASAQRGTITLNADGSFLYTPLPNVSGGDSFTYRLSDGTATSNVATVSFAITETADPPKAVDDAATTPEDAAITINVVGNDTDPDSQQLTLQSVTQPPNGTAAIVSGQVHYTPKANFNGQDVFSYTITDGTGTSTAKVVVTVTPVNDLAVAVADTYSTAKRVTLTVPAPGVLSNDTDLDGGQTLTARLISGPANGTLSLQANGSFTYTSTGGFTGTDTFTYRVNDGTADGSTATVTITVTGVNDPPVALNDSYATDRGTALTIPAPGILGNDSDPDGDAITAVLVAGPTAAMGTLSLNGNGSFTFTPASAFTGTATFTYRVRDTANAFSSNAAVTITVTEANRAPVAVNDSYSTDRNTALTIAAPGVLANDDDPDTADTITAVIISQPSTGTGSVTLNANGSFTYTPPNGYTGTATFRYRAKDQKNLESADATVSIEVRAGGQVCYDGGASYPAARVTLLWTKAANGDVTVRATASRNYVDNTYGANDIGWSGNGHDFDDLYRSDMAQLAFYDANNVRQMEFALDYLAPKSGTASGYGTQGVGGGPQSDGGMILGSASNIASIRTSMDLNLNAFGYVTTASNHPLKINSPATNALYTANTTYPNWIYDVWYEATVRAGAFGSAGFGSPRLTSLHASPSKLNVTSWRQITCQ